MAPREVLKNLFPKTALKKEVRDWMLARYVVDHFERAGSFIQGEILFNQHFLGETVEMMGNTALGPFVVKIRDETLADKEIEDFYNLCVAGKLYEGLLISQNNPMDKVMQSTLLFDNKLMVNWFRVRNINDAVKHVAAHYTFEVVFEGADAYMVCTPRILPKKKV